MPYFFKVLLTTKGFMEIIPMKPFFIYFFPNQRFAAAKRIYSRRVKVFWGRANIYYLKNIDILQSFPPRLSFPITVAFFLPFYWLAKEKSNKYNQKRSNT
jgi:hypothetical protein